MGVNYLVKIAREKYSDSSLCREKIKLTKGARVYMYEMTGCKKVTELDALSAHTFLENHDLAYAEGYHWPYDTAIWYAYADHHGIKRTMKAEKFYKAIPRNPFKSNPDIPRLLS